MQLTEDEGPWLTCALFVTKAGPSATAGLCIEGTIEGGVVAPGDMLSAVIQIRAGATPVDASFQVARRGGALIHSKQISIGPHLSYNAVCEVEGPFTEGINEFDVFVGGRFMTRMHVFIHNQPATLGTMPQGSRAVS